MAKQDKIDQAWLFRVACLQDMEAMSAVYARHSFAPHSHDTFVIELVESGGDEFICNGKRFLAEAGDVILLNPGDVHTGRSHGHSALRYRSLYPTVQLLESFGSEDINPELKATRFAVPVVRDADLANALRTTHMLCELGDSDALPAFANLVNQLQPYLALDAPSIDVDERLRDAGQLLSQDLDQSLSLDEVAQRAALSPFHFSRKFRHVFGLPPHRFRLNVRVAESRRLLQAGASLAEAALRTGFADQSHLSRNFKKIVGVTPGQFCLGLSCQA